jgi:phage shock protein PspC (stress-responsive transcriptional regulator)
MDKITRIHIAKIPYEIGVSAQVELKKYLDDIRRELDADLVEDIMADIEVRITEILADRNIKRNDVIASEDVDAVKEQLGTPEQFNDQEAKNTNKKRQLSGSRKLLRDTDDAIIGGVAGGLGAYFNLDPVLFRIGFIVLVLFWGFGILLYLLLWLLVPPAVTNSEKLQMKGEPVTAAALQRYRNSAERTISNLKIRSVVIVIFKLLRVFFTAGAILFVLALLISMGLANAVLYTQPLHPLYSAYHLNYVLLGLLWLLIMVVIGLVLVALLRVWQKRTAPLKIAFIALIGVMVVTLAGIAVVSPFVANYYKNKYGDNRLAQALPIQTLGTTPPTTFNLAADNNLDVSYVITNQPPHATYQAFPGMVRPQIRVINTNGTISLSAQQLNKAAPSCLLDWCKHLYVPVKVTLYGPAVQKYSVNGGAELDLENINQSNLSIIGQNNANIYVDSSYASTMSLSAESNSYISTSDTTALTANINIQQNSSVNAPTSDTLNATLPGNCYQTVLFLNQSPLSATINAQPTTIQALNQNDCVNIDGSGPPPPPSPVINSKIVNVNP